MCAHRIAILEEEIFILETSLKEKRTELKEEKDKGRELRNNLRTDEKILRGTGANSSLSDPSFAVILNGTFFLLRSPNHWESNLPDGVAPELRLKKKRLQSASISVENDEVWACIARYTNYTDYELGRTSEFDKRYPRLRQMIMQFGANNVDICVLGPQHQYYARWSNGSWICKGSDAFVQTIKGFDKDKSTVKAISFGFGTSYFISYENAAGRTLRKYNLEGHYTNLRQFLDARQAGRLITSIHAVTLDPQNKTDYLIIFTDGRSKTPRLELFCSEEKTRKLVEKWWAEDRMREKS